MSGLYDCVGAPSLACTEAKPSDTPGTGSFMTTLKEKGLYGTTRVLERKKRSSRNESKKQRSCDSGRVEIEVRMNQSLTLGSTPVIPPPCRYIGPPPTQMVLFLFSFLAWVSKTQPNHWTKRMASTRLAT